MIELLPDGALPEWLWLALFRGEPARPPAGTPTAEAWRALVAARREKLRMMQASYEYQATGRRGA